MGPINTGFAAANRFGDGAPIAWTHLAGELSGPQAGLVLEIGVGSGLNLPLYGSAVDHGCAIDPSPELLRLARNRIAMGRCRCRWVRGSAEQIRSRTRSFKPRIRAMSELSGAGVIDPKVSHSPTLFSKV
jgi:hypothetical protein